MFFRRSAFTLHLILQHLDLGVGVVDELIHMLTEHVVLVSQSFGQVFLVDDLLRRLVTVERQTTTCTLHDDRWTEAAQHAGLVIFRGV
jgi:hypothetical protein